MQGSYLVEKKELYQTVEGNSVPIMYAAGDSSTGGYIEGVFRIDWTTEGYSFDTHTGGGITGQGWFTTDTRSPFFNFTNEQLDEVVTYANSYGELNSYFSAWGNRNDINGEQRSEFATYTITIGCGAIILN